MKSKTLAAWLAFLGGPIGLHRFYLHGLGDKWGWLMPVSNKIDLFQFTMTSNSINFDGTKTYPGEICPFFTGILRSLFFQ